MDPVTLIVTALSSGAAAGLKPTAEKVIKDGYESLKRLLGHKYSGVDVHPLEKKPGSRAKRDSLATALSRAGAAEDTEVFHAAQALVRLILDKSPDSAKSVGIELEQLRVGGSLNFKNVSTDGPIHLKDVETVGDFNFEGVTSERSKAPTVRGSGGDSVPNA